MKKVTITLKGEVGKDITLSKIKSQIKGDTEEVLFLIDSEGGLIDEAFEILYFFDTVKSKIRVKTEITKNCFSAATVLALIPDNIEDRVINENGKFLIHLPYIQGDSLCSLDACNADYLQRASDYARLKEDCMIDIYKHKTNNEEGVIRELMIQNKPLTPAQSEAYKFIKVKPKNKMFQKIVNLFKGTKVKALVELTSDKGVLQLSSEDLENAIGAEATLEGEVALDGVYIVDTNIITVEEGIVTSIKECEVEEVIVAELEEVQEEIKEVQEEVTEELVAEVKEEEKEVIKPTVVAKSYKMPTINPNNKTVKMNQKQEFAVFAQNILAKAGAKMKSGEFVVKANALTSGLTYTYNGIEDLRDIFFKPTIETPEVQQMFEILYGVKSGQQLFSVGGLSNIVKKSLGNCDATPSSETTTISARKLETSPLKVELRECAEVFNSVVFEYWLKSGAEKNNLEGTEIEAIIMKVVTDAIRRDIFRILSFGNVTSLNANFNQLDGLWTRLFAGELTGDVVKVDTITALNTGNPTANAEYYLRRLEQGSPLELRGLAPEEKAIYVTQNAYDNYLSMLEGKNSTESAFKLMLDGSRQLTFRGIPVIAVPAWDNSIAILGGTDTLMLYTTKMNHVVGIDGDNSLQEVKFVYDVASDKNIIRAKMSIGYNYKTGGLQGISYGNI